MIGSEPGRAALATSDQAAAVAADAGNVTTEPAVEAVSEAVSEAVAGSAFDAEATGDPRVDAALRRLPDVDALPTDEHASVYEDVHRRLRAVLDGVAVGEHDVSPDGPSSTDRPTGEG
jgi:hypothetical protein